MRFTTLREMFANIIETQQPSDRKRLEAALYLGARLSLMAIDAHGQYSSREGVEALRKELYGDTVAPVAVPESEAATEPEASHPEIVEQQR